MSNIHYFQRYSQPENVVTNNTLLLCSRLYQHSAYAFNGFLSDLLGGVDIESGVQFAQQIKNGSVPDGFILQNSFKLVIETKLYNQYTALQLAQLILIQN